jgi:siroheme synthase
VVMAASRPEQRQVVARLDGIAEAARAAGIGAPAVLVVGEVVQLAGSLGQPLMDELAAAGAELT